MIKEGDEIDMKRAKYITSKKGLELAGLISRSEEEKPPLIWIDGLISMEEAENLQSYQRVNKIPCMNYLCFKSTFFQQLNIVKSQFQNLYDIYPPTYILPNDFPEFQRKHLVICSKNINPPTWVIKPKSGSCGNGIKLIQSLHELDDVIDNSIAQLYINPYLINGYKFDFRFYLLISSLEPFSAFIYKEGIARFCTTPFSPPSKSNKNQNFVHLTNTAINISSLKTPDEFTKLSSEILKQFGSYQTLIWEEIKNISGLVLSAIYPSILAVLPKPLNNIKNFNIKTERKNSLKLDSNKKVLRIQTSKTRNIKSNLNNLENKNLIIDNEENLKDINLSINKKFFHILGIDIIIDQDMKPFVLELNDRPSLSVTVPFEAELKSNLINETFYHITHNGKTIFNHPKSNWEQIIPFNDQEKNQIIQKVLNRTSNIKYSGRPPEKNPLINNMMNKGINMDLHLQRRNRFEQITNSIQDKKFNHYTK